MRRKIDGNFDVTVTARNGIWWNIRLHLRPGPFRDLIRSMIDQVRKVSRR